MNKNRLIAAFLLAASSLQAAIANDKNNEQELYSELPIDRMYGVRLGDNLKDIQSKGFIIKECSSLEKYKKTITCNIAGDYMKEYLEFALYVHDKLGIQTIMNIEVFYIDSQEKLNQFNEDALDTVYLHHNQYREPTKTGKGFVEWKDKKGNIAHVIVDHPEGVGFGSIISRLMTSNKPNNQ